MFLSFAFAHELSRLLLKGNLANQNVPGIRGYRGAVREAMVRELLPVGTEETWMALIRSQYFISHSSTFQ